MRASELQTFYTPCYLTNSHFFSFVIRLILYLFWKKLQNLVNDLIYFENKKKRELAAQTPSVHIECILKSLSLTHLLIFLIGNQLADWRAYMCIKLRMCTCVKCKLLFFFFICNGPRAWNAVSICCCFFECHKMRNRCQLQTFVFVLQRFFFSRFNFFSSIRLCLVKVLK